MPEAKMRKYVVTLQRRVKNVTSTLQIIVEATHRRKAAWVAEHSTNTQHGPEAKNANPGWRIQKIEVAESDSDLPNDIDAEGL